MTRAEKLAAIDSIFLPVIETKKQAVSDAKTNYYNETTSLEEKLIEYNGKIAEVNTYYDAQEKIAELMALTEPEV